GFWPRAPAPRPGWGAPPPARRSKAGAGKPVLEPRERDAPRRERAPAPPELPRIPAWRMMRARSVGTMAGGMRILVLGSGLMGPAAAFDAMRDPAVARVGLCDASERQLDLALRRLAGKPGADKLAPVRLDLADRPAAAALAAGFDAVVSAVPAGATAAAVRAAVGGGVPVVTLAWPRAGGLADLRRAASAGARLGGLGARG